LKKLLPVLALLMCASSAAVAADLPVYTKASPPVAGGWTGFYAGANIGYGWQDPTVVFTPNDQFSAFLINGGVGTNFTPVRPPTSFDIAGVTGGFQAGYNRQFDQRWLLGVETDFNFSDVKGQGAAPFIGVPGIGNQPFSALASEQVKWFGTVRARAGYLPTPDLLVFATGGLAYGRVEHSASLTNLGPAFSVSIVGAVNCSAGVPCYAGSSSRIATGWTAGGGLEYALGRNWTVKGEYLYVHLGNDGFAAPAINTTAPATSGVNVSYSDTTFNLVRIGANYHF
jgi:outer membrane immunogenic protein